MMKMFHVPCLIFVVLTYTVTLKGQRMEPITVLDADFYCKENAKVHHTDEYDLVNSETPTPILRRGEKFYVALKFDRPYDPDRDAIRIIFGFGEKPNVLRGTKVVRPIHPRQKRFPDDAFQWGALLSQNLGDSIVVQVRIPPQVQVGIWNVQIVSNIAGEKQPRNEYKVPDDVYILFNPWCPDDDVYMDDEEERSEYILNETGKIWCGTFKQPKGKHWIFGQFDEISLPTAVFLLEKSGLDPTGRGSPVMIARAISAIINSVDDAGLLEGRWDGNYEDGTSPFAWTGSTAIMEQYLSSGGQPVKYGQCWVYSAATVTVCRALGIPCRSTTNYVSAHDTNRSLTVDKYFDIFGNKIENGPQGDCSDSCWNFHVWNDVWMARRDLPAGYGGWQVIDATPQETSENIMRCGPTSVAAVKKGEVGYLYDTPFVFSEVNADIVHFQEDEESDWGFKRLSVNQYHVGRKIITKRPGPTDDAGEADLLDVTRLFKNKEGTEAERLAVFNAVRGVPRAQELYEFPDKDAEDVSFDLVDIDAVPFGEKFTVQMDVVNNAAEERTVRAMLSSSSVYYTGTFAKDIKKVQGNVKVGAGGRETIRMVVEHGDYLDKLVDHSLIKIYALANVEETKQTWSEEDDFVMIMPEVTISVLGICKVGEKCDVNFSFKNPLNTPLTNCSYSVEGPGLSRPKSVKYRDVEPMELVSLSENFVAKRAGQRKIVVNFTSKEIQHINGTIPVTIE